MEKETSNNEPNQIQIAVEESNHIQENPIIEEGKIPEEPKKLSLADINPPDLIAKIENFFSDKLQTMESKFENDLVIVQPYKFQFIDLYHELENLKQEISDFFKKEEEKKSNLKKPAGGGITRNNTSRSRTPIKFNATNKLASARDVTKSANLKGDLDKTRSRTPLTAVKTNTKSIKDVSVSKTDTKKTLNTTVHTPSTLNTTRAANTAKKPGIAEASAKKRDLTPVTTTKTGKALDSVGVSSNEPAHTEHGNTAAKNTKSNKPGIKSEVKSHVASAVLKKAPNENANIDNSSKRKSALNLNSNATAEGQPEVSSFNSSVDLTAKKKSILGGGLNTDLNSDVPVNCLSNNNLLENNGSNTARGSINKGNVKGERKASVPTQRASVSGSKRNSVEGKKENLNGSVDGKGENNAEKANNNSKNVNEKRKSIEVKKMDIDKSDKQVGNLVDNEVKINSAEVSQNIDDSNAGKENNISKAQENARNETRKSISEMIFENQPQEETIKKDDKINISNAVNAQGEKRQSIKQVNDAMKSDNVNASEKEQNDVKVAEERKKSVLSDSLINATTVLDEVKKKEEFKVENNDNKDDIKETKITGQAEVSNLLAYTEAKKAISGIKKNLLLSFSNKKSCALHLLIKSGLLTIKEQFRVVYCNKELISNHVSEIKEELFIFLKDKIAEYEALVSKYKSDLSNLTIINKQLTFSKTAVNGLNFVKKEEENNLMKKEQNEKVVDVFKFFCTLLNENFESLPSNKIIEFFMLTVLPKYKVESIKKFVSEFIPANILSFDLQLEKILDFVNKHHHILVSNELLSLNRSVSYITFSNKEIFEYLSAKLSDGNYAYYNRQANGLMKKYNEVLNKLGQ